MYLEHNRHKITNMWRKNLNLQCGTLRIRFRAATWRNVANDTYSGTLYLLVMLVENGKRLQVRIPRDAAVFVRPGDECFTSWAPRGPARHNKATTYLVLRVLRPYRHAARLLCPLFMSYSPFFLANVVAMQGNKQEVTDCCESFYTSIGNQQCKVLHSTLLVSY